MVPRATRAVCELFGMLLCILFIAHVYTDSIQIHVPLITRDGDQKNTSVSSTAAVTSTNEIGHVASPSPAMKANDVGQAPSPSPSMAIKMHADAVNACRASGASVGLPPDAESLLQPFGVSLWRAKGPTTSIALMTQGSHKEVIAWLSMYQVLPARGDVSMFLVTYDTALSESECEAFAVASESGGGPRLATCLFAPNSTWTTGRNYAVRSIYSAEVTRGALFTHWILTDQDVVRLACMSGGSDGRDAGICSPFSPIETPYGITSRHPWNIVTQLLAGRSAALDLPFISFGIGPYGDPKNPSQAYCDSACKDKCICMIGVEYPDPIGVIIARAAVPVLLPYFADMDSFSWQSSGHTAFYTLSVCLPDSQYFIPSMMLVGTGDHTNYPKGLDWDKSFSLVERAFPGLTGGPPPDGQTGHRPMTYPGVWRFVELNLDRPSDVLAAAAWRTSHAFTACVPETLARFCHYVVTGKGDTAWDGRPAQ